MTPIGQIKNKVQPRYFGSLSQDFWNQVNSIKNKKKRNELYRLGAILQSLEHLILDKLDGKKTGQRIYCVFCGAKLKRDNCGRYCPTKNCQWSLTGTADLNDPD